jgi:hypothetical protein
MQCNDAMAVALQIQSTRCWEATHQPLPRCDMRRKTIWDLERERERERLDMQLDSELEATFPASDAPKITQGQPNSPESVRATTEKN